MLELEQVSKSYNDLVVLHPLNLRVTAGQTLALVGPSGCGKSTLLRLMLGLIVPDAGQVTFDGQPMSGDAVLEQRHRIGYVIQDGGLFPHLTARGNVCLLAAHMGWTADRQQQRVEELAELTHLPMDVVDRYPDQLSGGQQQRIALMRALMLDPVVLLFDEPLGALDPLIRADLQADLREIFRTLKKTVVLVTHDIAEAAYLGDEIVLMRAGRLVQQGTIRGLIDEPADPFVTRFITAQRPLTEEVAS